MKRSFCTALLISCLTLAQWAAAEGPLVLKKGDHIAIVGSGLADRQQHHGWLEALIHQANPGLELTVRNLGFAADEVNVHPRSDEAPNTEYFLNMKPGKLATKAGGTEVVYTAGADFHASVILAYWGFNESFKGEAGLSQFKSAVDEYLKKLTTTDYGQGPPQVVLLSPIAHENVHDPVNYPDGAANNANLEKYTAAMAEVAAAQHVPFVDLYHASQALYAAAAHPLTINGIHLTEEGDRLLAPVQFQSLFGHAASTADPTLPKIREAVLEKNLQWHHRYRTVDQFNIYGGRSRIAYPDAKDAQNAPNNATVLGEEMAQRDVKTVNRDHAIWAAAQGKPFTIKDDNLPPVTSTPPNRPDPVPYLSGAESLKHLSTPSGVKVEFIASEKEFPELINPVQMNFDTRGRLWVAAWPTYPETTPTTTNYDKLLVFDIDPSTGKFTKCTTFIDGLNCPTGFQFYKDGVLVMQSPDMWWVRDTDGDGKADWKERIVHGLDAADSHHETNSICYEPGGAVYFSDGVFHRSNVETIIGPVRNTDGAIYRYEPRTSNFTRYIASYFANPHGRVFDYWGNDLITDATGNANYFGTPFSANLSQGTHPGMKEFWNRPSRPCPGTAILSSRHFPDDWQGTFLNANVIGYQGIFRAKITPEGSGIKGETLEPGLLETNVASNPNFRPSGMAVAPDGSIYVMDWAQMLIGHLQHHLRDPNRDHQHGGIYRLTYPSRPLLTPKKIYGESIEHLVELLKEPEDNVRLRAKIELDTHETPQVIAAVQRWEAALDKAAAGYEHHRLEALWVHQWHNIVNLDLLKAVLHSAEPRARAQAVRVLCYWRDRVPDALALIKVAAADEDPRVRLHAVRAASFFDTPAAADAALTVLGKPRDYYLDYCLTETMRQLDPVVKAAISAGTSLAADVPEATEYLLAKINPQELLTLPKNALTSTAMLSNAGIPEANRLEAALFLAEQKKTTLAGELLSALERPTSPARDLGRLLARQPATELQPLRARLATLAAGKGDAVPAAIAASMTAAGSIDAAWTAAQASATALATWLQAVPMMDPALRPSAHAKVHPLLTGLPPALQSTGPQSAGGRFVKLELPRPGTLTLAEVQVMSGGVNIAPHGKAKQSSESNSGAAGRAIDGNTAGSYGAGSSTHTVENQPNPWWEVDLGSDQPIESVTIFNRTDEQLGKRLHGFTLTVRDSRGQEIFKVADQPAPAVSATIAINAVNPESVVRRAALRAVLVTGSDAAATFTDLATLIEKAIDLPAAADALMKLPQTAWKKERAAAMLAAILTWTQHTAAEARNQPDYLTTWQAGQALAALLPREAAAAARTALKAVKVNVVALKTVPEQLRYDTTRIVVEAGKATEILFANDDAMPHNFVLVAPGTRNALAATALTMDPRKKDGKGRACIPESPSVLAATKMLEPGQSERLIYQAAAETQEYEFFCSFPGHGVVMGGRFIVTPDVDAYLAEHPALPNSLPMPQ